MNKEGLAALERIFNYCEEIDNNLPEEEKSGYNMLPDVLLLTDILYDFVSKRKIEEVINQIKVKDYVDHHVRSVVHEALDELEEKSYVDNV